MKKKWREISTTNLSHICSVLNLLAEAGVVEESIKVVSTPNDYIVYYFIDDDTYWEKIYNKI